MKALPFPLRLPVVAAPSRTMPLHITVADALMVAVSTPLTLESVTP